jgi:hypothetical protein
VSAAARATAVRGAGLSAALREHGPLAAIVLVAFGVCAYYSLRLDSWLVMEDELRHVRLALSIADGLSPVPEIRDEYYAYTGQLYPLLISPLYALLSAPAAFTAAHVLGPALMASTAVPAFGLAREVTGSRPAGLLVAALSVAVPWMALSALLMTEVVAYPVFVWALWAIQRALADPSPRRDLVALGAVLVAFVARNQLVVLGFALAAAALLHPLGLALVQGRGLRAGLREALRSHRALWLALGAGLVVAVPLAIAGVLGEALGTYEETTRGIFPPGTLRFTAQHLDFVAVAVGVVPVVMAVGWAVDTLRAPRDRPDHAFAALVFVLVPVLALQVGSYSLRYGETIHDRYLSYLAPLLFVGMAACLLDPRRRVVPVLVAGGVVAWLLSLSSFASAPGPWFDSPASAFHQVIDGRADQLLGLSPKAAVVGGSLVVTGLVALALWRLSPRAALLAVALPVLVFCALETRYVIAKVTLEPGQARAVTGEDPGERDWVDEAMPEGTVAMLASQVRDGYFAQRLWWDTEFWNERVTREWVLGPYESSTSFAGDPLSLDRRTGRIAVSRAADAVVVSREDPRLGLAGRVLARGPAGLVLVRPAQPLRADWATTGLDPDGYTTPGRPAEITAYRALELSVELTAPPEAREPMRWTLSGRRGALEPGATTVVELGCRRGTADLLVRDGASLPFGRRVGLRVPRLRSRPCRRVRG